MPNKTTIEQWRAFLIFEETGTYAKAAERLHRSPSSVFESIKQLSDRLGVQLMSVAGRRTIISPEGNALLRRAKWIVNEMDHMEQLAKNFSSNWEAEIGIAIESVFPHIWLRQILIEFDRLADTPRVQIHDTTLSQTQSLLKRGTVDIAVLPEVPKGYVGRMLFSMPFIAVVNPDHPLLNSGGELRMSELLTQRQIVVRDPGTEAEDAGWLVADRRWTVSTMRQRIDCVLDGLGFAWLPMPSILDDLEKGNLVEIPLTEGARREVPLYLVFADRESAGPGVLKLADIFSRVCQELIGFDASKGLEISPQ